MHAARLLIPGGAELSTAGTVNLPMLQAPIISVADDLLTARDLAAGLIGVKRRHSYSLSAFLFFISSR